MSRFSCVLPLCVYIVWFHPCSLSLCLCYLGNLGVFPCVSFRELWFRVLFVSSFPSLGLSLVLFSLLLFSPSKIKLLRITASAHILGPFSKHHTTGAAAVTVAGTFITECMTNGSAGELTKHLNYRKLLWQELYNKIKNSAFISNSLWP